MSGRYRVVSKDPFFELNQEFCNDTDSENFRRDDPPILLSACLAGIRCRFDGKIRCPEAFKQPADENRAILICPELAGGLSVPRNPAELIGGTSEDLLRIYGILTETGEINRDKLQGELCPVNEDSCNPRIINKIGGDVTDFYIRGAVETLRIAEKYNIRNAVLKAKSPACGKGKIYDGTFSRTLINGNGIAAELLMRSGITVITEGEAGNQLL